MSLSEIDAELLELEEQRRINLARTNLLAFTLFTKQDYETNWHHKAMADFIMRWLRGEFRFGMIFVPPRMGKSELVSRRLPAFVHGVMPNDEIMAASYNDSLATDMTLDVQRIMDEPEYKILFPNSQILAPGLHRQGHVRNTEEHTLMDARGRLLKGKYRGQGVGGTFTGRGANKIILDDLVKGREQAESEAFRRKLMNWYDSDLRTRLEKGGQILLTLTRWHELDIAGELLKRMASSNMVDQWEVFRLQAIREEEDNPYDLRAMGEALWPNKYTLEDHNAQRANDPAAFESLGQQNPTAVKGKLFKREWTTKRYTALPQLPNGRWDAACISADVRFKSDGKSGDMVVLDAWGRLGGYFYYLGEARGRWSFTETLDEFVKFCARFPNIKWKLIENKANGPALENVLKKHITGIELVEPQGGKEARLNAVTPLWRAGNVILPDRSICPNIEDVIQEWVSFGPGCAFDDRTDTMSQALIKLDNGILNKLKALAAW